MTRIAVLGCGYVGLVSGTCFAELGHAVVALDRDAAKIATLEAGAAPFFEPGLDELIARNRAAGRLSFSSDLAAGVRGAEIVVIAVGTPLDAEGNPDLSDVRAAARTIGSTLNGPKIVLSKSTVPLETGELIASIIAETAVGAHPVEVVSNPEFLREGSAVHDFLHPDRIIIGSASPEAVAVVTELYRPLGAPIVVTDVRTSEMVKYAANAFLATKISFMNEIANLCERVGVDVDDVARGIGLDHRIGTAGMQPGLGYGGSCLPKDVRALGQLARAHDYDAQLLEAVEAVNVRQIDRVVAKIVAAVGGALAGKHVGVLGLAFKPNTDDLRGAPALAVIERLLVAGATVTAHDPAAMPGVRLRIGDRIGYADDALGATFAADAAVLCTEWPEYGELDFALVATLMRGDVLVDARNALEAAAVRQAGLRYLGVGRPALAAPATHLRQESV